MAKNLPLLRGFRIHEQHDNMMLEKVNRPTITIAHILTTIGMIGGLLVVVNATENKVEKTEARQEMVIQNQQEIKQDFKAYQIEQRQMQQQQMQLLHQIKGKLEK